MPSEAKNIQEQGFRSSLFGFDKNDVLAYMSALADETQQHEMEYEQKLRQLQTELDALPDVFSVTDVEMLRDIAARIAKLQPSERMILDTTKLTKLQNALAQYNEQLKADMQQVKDAVDSVYAGVAAAAAAVAAATAAAFVARRRGVRR